MKHFFEARGSRKLLSAASNVAAGAVIGTLIGFLLHLQHFFVSEPVEGSPYLNGKGQIAICALVGAVLLPATIAAFRWAAKRYLASLLASLRQRTAAHERLLP
jgi:hypothetical protein